MKKKSKILNKLITAMFAVLCVALLCVPAFAVAPAGGDLVEILPPTVMESADSTSFVSRIPVSSGIVLGESYIVNWNGVEYKATALDLDLMGLGLPTLFNDGLNLDTGEGAVFAIQLDPDGAVDGNNTFYCFACSLDGNVPSQLTISIYQVVESPSGALFTDISTLVDSSVGWVGQFVNAVTAQPLLLCFCIVIFVGVGVGLISRIKR